MRVIWVTTILLIAGLTVASCMAVEEPPVLPVRTATISLSPTSLSPNMTFTPLPTLTADEAKISIQILLENNAECQLPCWWGITPGKTTWLEARHFLESVSMYILEEKSSKLKDVSIATVAIPLPSPYSNATYMAHKYFVKNGVVDSIEVYNFNLAYSYYIPKFLDTYGQPEEVWIRTFAKEEMGIQNYMVDLFYQNLGVLLEYSTGEPLDDVNGKLQNCLIKDMDSPFIFLWSPEEQILSFQDAKQKFLDTSNLPEPKPLFEATGMDVKTFYEIFKNPDTDVCLETPKNLWP